MADMLKKLERVSNRHNKLKVKIEAMKQQLLAEEKAMQKEKDRLNSKWMRKFASLAEDRGVQVYDLDPVKILEMITVSPKDFYVEGYDINAAGVISASSNKENVQESNTAEKTIGQMKEEP